MGFAELNLILMSDHNDNFSKYSPKIVTDYSYNGQYITLKLYFRLQLR